MLVMLQYGRGRRGQGGVHLTDGGEHGRLGEVLTVPGGDRSGRVILSHA